MEQKSARTWSIYLTLFTLITVVALYIRYKGFYFEAEGRDIYYGWLDGQRLLQGQNPYQRILSSDMIVNAKYPTQFPLYYFLCAAMIRSGFPLFNDWIIAWRFIVILFDVLIGIFIFYYAQKCQKPLAGLLGVFLWYFSRWSLCVWEKANIESMVLFILIISLYNWERRPTLASLLFGLSLSLKHMGILILPLLLLRSKDWRVLFQRLLFVSIVPLLVSLPFLIWNFEAFFRSIFFNLTCQAGGHIKGDSRLIAMIFGTHGLLSRTLLFLAYILFYLTFLKRTANLWLIATVGFLFFISFNPVPHIQYFSWFVPFLALFLIDYLLLEEKAQVQQAGKE